MLSNLLLRNTIFLCLFCTAIISCTTQINAQDFNWAIPFGGSFSVASSANESTESVCVDKAGNAYVVGHFDGTRDFDPGSAVALASPLGNKGSGIFLAKFDFSGRLQWRKCIAGSFDSALDKSSIVVQDVVVDDVGRVTVIGRFSGTLYFDGGNGVDSLASPLGIISGTSNYALFLTQYDAEGKPVWMKTIVNTPGSRLLEANPALSFNIMAEGGMAVDSKGDIYIAGYFAGSYDFDPGIKVFEVNGSLPPVRRNANSTNSFVAKYRWNGDFCWAKELKVDSTEADTSARRVSYYCQLRRIAVDTLNGVNNVLLAGYFEGPVDVDPGTGRTILKAPMFQGDICLVKLDSSGQYKWAGQIGGSGLDDVHGLAVSNRGNIYVSGETNSVDMDFDPGMGMAIIPPKGLRDIYMAKYDTEGNHMWSKRGGGDDYVFAIRCELGTDHLENAYLLSTFNTVFADTLSHPSVDLDMGPDTATFYLERNPIYTPGIGQFTGSYIAQYDACGNYLWAGEMQGGSYTFPTNLAIQTADADTSSVYITGRFDHKMGLEQDVFPDFDPGPATATMQVNDSLVYSYLMKLNFHMPAIDTLVCGSDFQLGDSLYLESGKFIYRQPVAGGCENALVLRLILSSIEQPVITVDSFVLGVSGHYESYQWMLAGMPLPEARDSIFKPLENGRYTVVVSNDAGCTDTSDIYIVENVHVQNRVRDIVSVAIHPNPVYDMLYVDAPDWVNVSITDVTGRVVKKEDRVRNLNLTCLSAGVYWIVIRDHAGQLLCSKKLMKQ